MFCLTRERVCRLQLLMIFASALILVSESRRTCDHMLLSQIRESSDLEVQVPVFISPRDRVAQFYPQALGSIFVASYDFQGYGGGIRPCIHARSLCCSEAETEACCRQSAGTLTSDIGPCWDPLPYICSTSRNLFFFSFRCSSLLIKKLLVFLYID
jgi:hypothetical protein